MSDLHLDIEYTVGAAKTCGSVICCRPRYGFPSEKSQQAGPIGSYQCDSPPALLNSMLDFINNTIKPEVVLWTGDTFPHNEWQSPSFEDKSVVLDVINTMLKANLTGPTLYPVIGNHDLAVSDLENFDELEPMINHTAYLWKDWLTEDSKRQYLENGCYTQKLKLNSG